MDFLIFSRLSTKPIVSGSKLYNIIPLQSSLIYRKKNKTFYNSVYMASTPAIAVADADTIAMDGCKRAFNKVSIFLLIDIII